MYGSTDNDSQQTTPVSRRRLSAQRPSPIHLEDGQKCGDSKLPVPQEEGITWTVYLLAGCAAVNSCNIGFDLGINADAGPNLQIDFHLSDDQYAMFISSINFSAMFGCVLASMISDHFGRRAGFAVSNATLLLGLAITCSAQSYEVLLGGRALVGLGIGFGLALDPVYIAEISPPSNRGWLVTWSEISINLGLCIGFVVGWALSTLPPGKAWRVMLAAGGVLPLVMLVLVTTVMYESPRWLLLNQRRQEADEVIQKLFGEQANVAAIRDEISLSLEQERKDYDKYSWLEVICPTGSLRPMILTGVCTGMAQQLGAIEPVIMYMQSIMKAAGESSRSALSRYPLMVGTVKIASVIIAGPIFDSHGRRPMMIASFVGIWFSFAGLSLLFTCGYTPPWLVVVALFCYVAAFEVGAGPGCWLMPSELFSNSVRAKAMGMTTLLNRGTGALMTMSFFPAIQSVGFGGIFAIYSVIAMCVAISMWAYLPETRLKTLEEISEDFLRVD